MQFADQIKFEHTFCIAPKQPLIFARIIFKWFLCLGSWSSSCWQSPQCWSCLSSVQVSYGDHKLHMSLLKSTTVMTVFFKPLSSWSDVSALKYRPSQYPLTRIETLSPSSSLTQWCWWPWFGCQRWFYYSWQICRTQLRIMPNIKCPLTFSGCIPCSWFRPSSTRGSCWTWFKV